MRRRSKAVADADTGARRRSSPDHPGQRGARRRSTAAREAAEKAAAEASTERDRITAETASAQQGAEALTQQVAQMKDQLAGRRVPRQASTRAPDEPTCATGCPNLADGRARWTRSKAFGGRERGAGQGHHAEISAAAQQSALDALKSASHPNSATMLAARKVPISPPSKHQIGPGAKPRWQAETPGVDGPDVDGRRGS